MKPRGLGIDDAGINEAAARLRGFIEAIGGQGLFGQVEGRDAASVADHPHLPARVTLAESIEQWWTVSGST